MARERLGWSQVDLARRMHVAQPTVSSWEAGKKAPRVTIMGRLSGILGVSFEWLSTGRGEMLLGKGPLMAREAVAEYLPEQEEDERRLLLCYARLKPPLRAALLGFLESLRG
jgi:transcriptional regulator with XRE-family HTH domain